jgi:hypothetical protein
MIKVYQSTIWVVALFQWLTTKKKIISIAINWDLKKKSETSIFFVINVNKNIYKIEL